MTGSLRSHGIHGYTLIEVLVVLAILGVLVTATAYGLRGDSARTIRTEAERLAGTLELAQARARLGAGALAFSASAGSYAFWRRDDSGVWREFTSGSDLQPRQLPQGISVTGVRVAGGAASLGQRIALQTDDPAAFAIDLSSADMRATVENSVYVGRVNVTMAAQNQ
jgi:type II secretion system protein H